MAITNRTIALYREIRSLGPDFNSQLTDDVLIDLIQKDDSFKPDDFYIEDSIIEKFEENKLLCYWFIHLHKLYIRHQNIIGSVILYLDSLKFTRSNGFVEMRSYANKKFYITNDIDIFNNIVSSKSFSSLKKWLRKDKVDKNIWVRDYLLKKYPYAMPYNYYENCNTENELHDINICYIFNKELSLITSGNYLNHIPVSIETEELIDKMRRAWSAKLFRDKQSSMCSVLITKEANKNLRKIYKISEVNRVTFVSDLIEDYYKKNKINKF